VAGVICDEVVQSAITGGGPTQTFTFALDGETPVLVVFYCFGTTSNSAAADALQSIGMTDGSNQVCVSIAGEDNVSPANTWQDFVSDEVILIMDPNTGAVDGEANISSLGANQAVISWGNYPSSAWKIGAFALAGSAVSAVVTNRTCANRIGNTDTFAHGLGAVPTGMIGLCADSNPAIDAGPGAGGRMSYGFASYDGSTIYHSSQSTYFIDGSSATRHAGRADSRRIVCPTHYAAAPVSELAEPHLEVTTVNSTNVIITTQNQNVAMDYGLAVITGCECYAGMWECPSGTGVKNFNLPVTVEDFYPKGVLLAQKLINYANINTNGTGNLHVPGGCGGISTDSSGSVNEHCGTVRSRNNAPGNTSDTASDFDTDCHEMPNHLGTYLHEAAWDNYDTDGYGINVTTGPVNSKAWPHLLFGVKRVEPSSHTSSSAFGSPTIVAVVSPTGFASSSAFGSAGIVAIVSPSSYASSSAFGSAGIIAVIQPSSLASSSAFGSVSFLLVLSPSSLASASAFGSAGIVAVVAPSSLTSSSAFGSPSFLLVLSPSGYVSASAFGAVIIPGPLQLGTVRGRIVFAGSVAARFALGGSVMARLVEAGTVAGRLIEAELGAPGRIAAAGTSAGRTTVSGARRALLALAGSVAGRIVGAGVPAGRITASGSKAGRVVASNSVAGRIVTSGTKAGRITHAE